MFKPQIPGMAAVLLAVVLALAAIACASTAEPVVQTVEVEKVVTKEVIQTVEVPKEVIVRDEIVKTVEVPRVVTQEVVVTKEVPMEQLPPLVVGNLNALTGSLSYFGESHSNSISLAADHINRAGGIQGGSVVLVHRDTGVNPVQGVAAAEELVNAREWQP